MYASMNALTRENIGNLASDTKKPVISIAPGLPEGASGLDLKEFSLHVPDEHLLLVNAFIKSANSLPAPARNRDPNKGRWTNKAEGTFEIWQSRQLRLICRVQSDQHEFGYTWDPSQEQLYFFRSSSCKKIGKCSRGGQFKLSERKREEGKIYWNIDLLTDDLKAASLLRLVPAGAGYRVFPREVPADFSPMHEFYAS